MFQIISTVFIIFVLSVIWLIVKIHTQYNYWKNKNVYTWKPNFPFGNARDVVLQKIPLGFDVSALYNDLKCKSKKFGGYYNFLTPVFIPVDLDLIKQILIYNSDHFINRVSHVDEENDPLTLNLVHVKDERWKKLRSKISPSFSNSKIKMFFLIMIKQIDTLVKMVEENVQKQEPLDVKEAMDRYILDVMGLFTCATNFNAVKNKNSNLQKQITNFFNTSFIDALVRYLITSPELLKIFKIRVIKKQTTNFFFDLVNDIITQRIKQGSEAMAVLDALVKCQTKETSNSEEEVTLNEIVANIAGLILAGYETTSNTLTFCLYELASNVEIQETLRSEIITLPQTPSYEDILSLPFLNKCINETLRRYPAVTIVTRKCTKTFNVPDSDLILEKGVHLYIPIQGILWDPEYYPNPEQFNPERFTEERLKNRHPCAWLPFGAGPRLCIGKKLATLSMRVVIINLLRNYKFTLNCRTQFPIEYDPNGFVLQPKNGVFLNVEKIEC